MSAGFVADSSVGVAWAVHAQASAATDRLLEDMAAGSALVVPVLWPLEVANSLLVLLRRKRILAADRERAVDALGRLPLVVDDEGPRRAFGRVSELATEHGLSVYDATYLELALRRRLPLATRDQALRQAAQDSGAELLL